MSFKEGFKWGVGMKFGSFVASIFIFILICLGLFFGFKYIASAVGWILTWLVILSWIVFLVWSGVKGDGLLRRRKLIMAAFLVLFGIVWFSNTTFRLASKSTSVSTTEQYEISLS